MTMASMRSLKGLRLLVVEDEAMIAMLIEDLVTDLGCVVVNIAGTVANGVAIAGSEDLTLDGAILDVDLRGEKVFPVAEALAARGVPFIFVTGYGAGFVGAYVNRPVVAKPFYRHTLQAALVRLFRL